MTQYRAKVFDQISNVKTRSAEPLTDEETGEPTGEVATVSVDEPLRALAFKIMDDRYGALSFTRIYSSHSKGNHYSFST